MSDLRIEVENIQAQLKRLREIEDSAVTREVNKGAADIVLARAQQTAPRGRGKLRRTGRTSGTKTAGVMRYGTAAVPYARNHHFGDLDRPQGGFILPNPWAYEAADDRRRQVFDHYEQRVNKLTRRF